MARTWRVDGESLRFLQPLRPDLLPGSKSSYIGALVGFFMSGILVHLVGSKVNQKFTDVGKAMWRTMKCSDVWRPSLYIWMGGGGGWEGGEQTVNVSYAHHQAQSQGLYQPLECNPTLQIGYDNPVCLEQIIATTQAHAQQGNAYILGWML